MHSNSSSYLENKIYLIDNKVLLTGEIMFTNGVCRPYVKANKNEARRRSKMLY